MDEAKKARLAWAATGRSASMLDTIVKSGNPAGVIERLAAAVTVKAPADEKQAAGYDIDTRVADAVFGEHCALLKAAIDDEKKKQAETVAVSEVEAAAIVAESIAVDESAATRGDSLGDSQAEEAAPVEAAATEGMEATASVDAAAIGADDDDELKP